MSNFDSDALTCHLALFPTKNRPNSAKSNRIFPGKETGDRTLILTYLDSPMAEVFPSKYTFFRFRPSSGGNGRTNLQKCKLWVRPFSIKTRILQKTFKQCFRLLKVKI